MSWLAENFAPMWIVWILELGLIAVVFLMVLRKRHRHSTIRDTVGMGAFTLLMILIFTSSILLAPLATSFSSPTRTDWWQMAALRVAWQLGGGLLLGAAMLWEAGHNDHLADPRVWAAAAGLVVVGGLLCTSSLRDLVDGPLVLRGRPALQVDRTPGGRGGGSIFAKLTLTAPDGTLHEVDTSGWEATRTSDRLAACKQADVVTVTMLRHVDAVLDVSCERSDHAPPR